MSSATNVSWLVSSIKQELGLETNQNAVQSAKSKLDEAFKLFLTTADEKIDYTSYDGCYSEVEKKLLNAAQMIRGLLGKLPETSHRPNGLIVETIDLTGIDDDDSDNDDEQTTPSDQSDELPELKLDETDFGSFSPVSQKPEHEKVSGF